ncbi:MAG: hypothetical protein IJR63_10900 [Synergistaceae bacterium]|nr:hypothetical protein [Synergistaceae bacterium]
MRKAAESAAKWLADKVRGNPKLNPIPYPFFKSIVNKQVEWARTQRGIALDFEELAEAVRTELLKAGIHTMSGSERKEVSLFDGAGGANPPVTLHLRADDNFTVLLKWLSEVIDSAESEKYTGLDLTAKITREARR